MAERGAPPPRYGFEAFDCAPGLRLEAHERVAELQTRAMTERLERMDAALERLERRLWLAVYGVVAAILAQAFQPLLAVLPG
ncbi:GTA head formation protein, RCAP_rcc01685 family [Roseovarius sp.]|uniref:GTA head formation protein, RCAP_rcc01685 family n=1 Tax=Roseovarius sp. TaxID=1486281 RepID=UPI003A987953